MANANSARWRKVVAITAPTCWLLLNTIGRCMLSADRRRPLGGIVEQHDQIAGCFLPSSYGLNLSTALQDVLGGAAYFHGHAAFSCCGQLASEASSFRAVMTTWRTTPDLDSFSVHFVRPTS